MTLITDSSVSKYSAQALVLLFFPGSSFPEDSGGGEPTVTLSVSDDGGVLTGRAEIKEGERRVERFFAPDAETVMRSDRKRLCNLAVGGALYLAGTEFCGVTPPWGILTGVRPAKMCRDMLECGITAAETEHILCHDYFCTPDKAHLAAETAVREAAVVTADEKKNCSVYIAIPFCPTKCSYCSFTSFSSPRLLSLIPDYLERLYEDIRNTFAIIKAEGLKVSTVYIGGGTPTVLDEARLEALLSAVCRSIDPASLREFTLEAGRPDTITAEKMRIAKDFGVTRVSVNAQTMNGDVLKSIGRRHTPEDFLRAYGIAAASGIRDINVDLIAGLPGESAESFSASCARIISLDPTNITVHTFYAKRAAEIVKSEKGVYRAKDTTASRAVSVAHASLLEAGYRPYYLYKQKNTAGNLENAGFSKVGHEGIYNILMMEEIHTVFGIGASAMTKFVSTADGGGKIRRLCETKYPYEYLDPAKNSAERHYRELSAACRAFYAAAAGDKNTNGSFAPKQTGNENI